jgi:hypothetical protein
MPGAGNQKVWQGAQVAAFVAETWCAETAETLEHIEGRD